jgi:hypothetical protein
VTFVTGLWLATTIAVSSCNNGDPGVTWPWIAATVTLLGMID